MAKGAICQANDPEFDPMVEGLPKLSSDHLHTCAMILMHTPLIKDVFLKKKKKKNPKVNLIDCKGGSDLRMRYHSPENNAKSFCF